MKRPFFSIIVPTYNRAEFLPRCIKSVYRQTFSDWELLIIDDGSTDHTKDLVAEHTRKDNRVKYFYQTNQRVSAARNLGLKNAAGNYLCFLDSDDEYEANHLQFFYEELSKKNFSEVFLSTGFKYKDGRSEQIQLSPIPQTYADKEIGKIMSAYLPYSPCVQTVCLPASIKERVKFDSRLNLSECYDFCARAAALVEDVIYFPITTVTLYGHTGNASVPNSIEDCIKFNSRQYKEFQLMSKDPFYSSIVKTKAFKKRLFFLQFELAKSAAKKKQAGQFAVSFLKAMRHHPSYLLQLNYARLFRKVIRKIKHRNVVLNP